MQLVDQYAAPISGAPSTKRGMRHRVNDFDWASTALGPMASWGAELRVAVEVLLGCGFPATLQWGRDLILLYNDAYVPLIGERHPEALGKPILESFPEIAETYQPFADRVWHGETVLLENQLYRYSRGAQPKDSWFNLSYSPVRAVDGNVAGILAIGFETTERFLAEDAKEEAYRELRRSETLLKKALDAETVGVLFFKLDGSILDSNSTFERMSGYSREELLKLHWESLTPPEFFQITESSARNLAERGDTPPYEKQLLRKDGSRWWGLFAPTRLNGTGLESECVEFVLDVTDRRAATESLRESEKLAVVGRLASSIAHEINNPLEAVTNLIYLAEQSAESAQTQQYLHHAQLELARVTHIATQTLRFSKHQTVPVATDVRELVDSVLTLYEGRIRGRGVRVKREYGDHTPSVLFANEVRQVVANLIANAIDAMARTPRKLLRVRVRNAIDGRTGRPGVRITIADTGEGMSESTQRRMGEPFFTTKEATGTGLGLWVTREIVHKNRGSLRVRSRRTPTPSGTVFRVFLPRTDA